MSRARSPAGRSPAAPRPTREALDGPRPAARGRVEPGAGRRARHRRERRLGHGGRARRALPAAGVVGARLRHRDGSAFPRTIPHFQGVLPPAIAAVAQTLEGHDLVLVAGAPVFTYYPYIPGPLLPEGTSLVLITSDPDEAARAPVGRRDRGRRGAHAGGAARADAETADRPPPAGAAGARAARRTRSRSRATAARRRSPRCFPPTGIIVNESPSNMLAFRNQVRLSRPGSYFFGAGGGLGFGLPAAVGVQLAQPDRPVVAVIGDGSAQYAIAGAVERGRPRRAADGAGAAQRGVRDPQVVRRVRGRDGCAGPRRARASTASRSRPGTACARAASRARTSCGSALAEAIASGAPELIEVTIAPGMSLA